MKRLIRKKVLLILAGLVIFSIPVAALTFAQCDVNHDGTINVLDLVRAKRYPGEYNEAFRDELTDVLLEKSKPKENSSGSAIYLPEIP